MGEDFVCVQEHGNECEDCIALGHPQTWGMLLLFVCYQSRLNAIGQDLGSDHLNDHNITIDIDLENHSIQSDKFLIFMITKFWSPLRSAFKE